MLFVNVLKAITGNGKLQVLLNMNTMKLAAMMRILLLLLTTLLMRKLLFHLVLILW